MVDKFKKVHKKHIAKPFISISGGVDQGVELLLCKCKALSSNSSPTKKRKKELSSVFQSF
jgi:hypothetical protein